MSGQDSSPAMLISLSKWLLLPPMALFSHGGHVPQFDDVEISCGRGEDFHLIDDGLPGHILEILPAGVQRANLARFP